MANCPNCGAPLSKDGVCAACGYAALNKPEDIDKLLKLGKFSEASVYVNEILSKDPNNGKACLDMVRILTKNFAEYIFLPFFLFCSYHLGLLKSL